MISVERDQVLVDARRAELMAAAATRHGWRGPAEPMRPEADAVTDRTRLRLTVIMPSLRLAR